MNMRTLFWKIFLSFWLVQAVFFAVAALLFRRSDSPNDFPGPPSQRNLVVFSEQEAVKTYQSYGSAALEHYLEDLQNTSGIRLSIVNTQGAAVSRAPLSPEENALAERVVRSERPERGAEGDRLLVADPVVGEGGDRLVAVAQLPTPRTPRRAPGPRPVRDLALGFVISGVVCFGLARYLTAPIARLRVATQRLSKGDLSARAGKESERRKDEIAELVGDFDKMAAQIQSLVNAQKRLIGDVSHELRSPLTRINLALEPLRKVDHPRVTTAVERIELETTRLDEMIRKLLSLSRLEAEGQLLEKSNVQLDELLSEVVADTDFEAQAEDRRVVPHRVDSCCVVGNRDLLRSAFENVILNAIRYTRGSDVEVTLHSQANPMGRWASVKVRDYGPGVPEGSLDALFRPFYRLDDSRERKTGGVGLGLAITKQAVTLHGGTVQAANVPDGGLVVTIMLPTVDVAPGGPTE